MQCLLGDYKVVKVNRTRLTLRYGEASNVFVVNKQLKTGFPFPLVHPKQYLQSRVKKPARCMKSYRSRLVYTFTLSVPFIIYHRTHHVFFAPQLECFQVI